MNVYSSALRRGADLMHIDSSKIWDRTVDVVVANWHLGFTAFGGPPVHFQILHKKFVEKYKWVDEQMYQEIFALSQALPGPASTKMLFCMNYLHGGLLAGIGAFLLWCLPGAIGMYALSLGVSRIGDTLPPPVYALLSGLNAATVGIIALAAVQLAQKAITDKVSRALVFLDGVTGMLYTALWFFPVLMAGAGVVTIVWDFRWVHRIYKRVWKPRRILSQETGEGPEPGQRSREEMSEERRAPYAAPDHDERSIHLRRMPVSEDLDPRSTELGASPGSFETTRELGDSQTSDRVVPPSLQMNILAWKTGLCLIGAFLISFIAIMVIRGLTKNPPRGISLFANLYLAGTIIFGGGPVVIPLLREYIVAEGWVSPRDFLLGLALIQSFPGPNFNFAVYLGSLATAGTSLPSSLGALIGFVGIFTPAIIDLLTPIASLYITTSRRIVPTADQALHNSAV
ncbi:putative chromate transport protein [Phaeomoniella chlamydospora]|uniref:Putative chromate transport protein n=1 Tax=Phaeomoniella chlamydospora TaxID=158046 RepID=A0A0G2EBZ2_PHACM|nr:putative chromate transport protein [Phaeomoniella chlamydospora]